MDKNNNINLSLISKDNPEIPTYSQHKTAGKLYVDYGRGNKFPQYLFELYTKSPILSSVINGITDYVLGEGIISGEINVGAKVWNDDGDLFEDIIKASVFDYLLYGGFALQLIYDKAGNLKELYHLDLTDIRVNEDCTLAYYCEEWGKYGKKAVEYPIYNHKDTKKYPTSVFYFKGHVARRNQVYPIPTYISALTDIETNKEVANYWLRSIHNDFTGNTLINFNNGQPEESVQREIEQKLNDKFTGTDNASKLIVSFNDNKDTATEITRIDSSDFADRFQALMKTTRENIFVAFRATPNLFGLMTETTGFNSQEFNEAFKLFDKTTIKPIQKDITRCFNKILGEDNSITFIPFSLDDKINE